MLGLELGWQCILNVYRTREYFHLWYYGENTYKTTLAHNDGSVVEQHFGINNIRRISSLYDWYGLYFLHFLKVFPGFGQQFAIHLFKRVLHGLMFWYDIRFFVKRNRFVKSRSNGSY